MITCGHRHIEKGKKYKCMVLRNLSTVVIFKGMEENQQKSPLMTGLCRVSIIVNNSGGIDYYPCHLLRVFASQGNNKKPQTITTI